MNFAICALFAGENRYGHRYWWFTCEKESIFVEREPTRWGRYTKKADIDQLLEALDDRSVIQMEFSTREGTKVKTLTPAGELERES